MSGIELMETRHPDKLALVRYEELIGLDDQKEQLLGELELLLDPGRLTKFLAEHHPGGLALASRAAARAPLVLLSGDVGCGKTALASSVASPLAERLDCRIACFETPSNIRGTGLVGEVSARITAAFRQAKERVGNGRGLLIIDEADDLATERAQMQAHHEDRAGLNVLVKQIDLLERDKLALAVILITNRADVLDPAVVRRAALHLRFERPDGAARRLLFERLLAGLTLRPRDLDALVAASDRKQVLYSYSDLVQRVGSIALRRALRENRPLSVQLVLDALGVTEPSPMLRPNPKDA